MRGKKLLSVLSRKQIFILKTSQSSFTSKVQMVFLQKVALELHRQDFSIQFHFSVQIFFFLCRKDFSIQVELWAASSRFLNSVSLLSADLFSFYVVKASRSSPTSKGVEILSLMRIVKTSRFSFFCLSTGPNFIKQIFLLCKQMRGYQLQQCKLELRVLNLGW